jgi:hypothetical protein
MKFPRMLRTLAAAVLATVLSGPAAGKVSPSTYCVAIDVTLENEDLLLERFDAFAVETGLLIDSSSPAMRLYYPPGENVRYPTDSSVDIAVTQMGPFGWILSYTLLRDDAPPNLLVQLQRFVDEEISQDYQTTLCEHIKGFSPPVLYH